MPFDVYHAVTGGILLYSLEDDQYNFLFDIFEEYYHQTGQYIDQYGDVTLDSSELKKLLSIIEKTLQKTESEGDIQQKNVMIEFKNFLDYYASQDISLRFLGD